MSYKIRRIIHLLWFDLGKGKQPYGKYLEGYQSWIKLNPNCEIKLWNKEDVENLILENLEYRFIWNNWNKLKLTIQKLDVARPLILHKYGGMYGDLDIICTRSVEPLFEYAEKTGKVLLMKTHYMFNMPTNSFYLSHKDNPFFYFYLEELNKRINNWKWFRSNSWLTVMSMTGPQSLSETVGKYSMIYGKDKFHIFNDKLLFPSPKYWTPDAFGKDYLVSGYGSIKLIINDTLGILLILCVILLFIFITFITFKFFKIGNNRHQNVNISHKLIN